MTAEPLRSPYSIHWPTKAGYSYASVGLSAIELMLQVFLLELYILAGLAPSMAGLAIAIAVIWARQRSQKPIRWATPGETHGIAKTPSQNRGIGQEPVESQLGTARQAPKAKEKRM